MFLWHRADANARRVLLGLLIAAGVIRLGVACYAAWSDNVEHDHARAEFLTDCEAEEAASTCATYVETRDKDCFFASGLSSAQAWGEADYQRCMWVGEAQYHAERALRGAAQRKRRQGIYE